MLAFPKLICCSVNNGWGTGEGSRDEHLGPELGTVGRVQNTKQQ